MTSTGIHIYIYIFIYIYTYTTPYIKRVSNNFGLLYNITGPCCLMDLYMLLCTTVYWELYTFV